jgi:hypothetical protein
MFARDLLASKFSVSVKADIPLQRGSERGYSILLICLAGD